MWDIESLPRLFIPVALALTVHEFAHAWAAAALGDDTARRAGRLTLNPLAHLDFAGSLVLLLSQAFGWAKPVPVNPARFRRPARDMALTALAGPLMNFAVAILLGLAFRLFIHLPFADHLDEGWAREGFRIFFTTVAININLAFFNLLPLPPLDGFQVIAPLLPSRALVFLYSRTSQLVLLALLFFLAYNGLLSHILAPLNLALQSVLF